MNFIGEECFGCKKIFNEDDDVVVCPDCGTPYHRSCYKEFGKCVNHQLHENGEAWVRTQSKPMPESNTLQAKKVCSHCQGLNGSDAEICQFCGEKIEPENNPRPEEAFFTGGFTENGNQEFNEILNDKVDDNVTFKEAMYFVDSNTFYYMPVFYRMNTNGKKASFSFVSLLFPYFYFANRRMWLPAIITAVISALLNIPEILHLIGLQGASMPFMGNVLTFIYDHETIINSMSEICSFLSWIMRFLCFLFANWIYFRHSIRTITKAKAKYGHNLTAAQLKSLGGVRPINILFIGLIIMGLSLIVELGVMTILMALV